jgi:hypothetical protein
VTCSAFGLSWSEISAISFSCASVVAVFTLGPTSTLNAACGVSPNSDPSLKYGISIPTRSAWKSAKRRPRPSICRNT